MNAPYSFLNFCLGLHGAMVHTLCCGTNVVIFHLRPECSKATPYPLLILLVLHKLISSIDADDDDYLQVFFQARYLDDGVLTGSRSAVLRSLPLIEELGHFLGIHINFVKCELFSHNGNSMFPSTVKFSQHHNLEIHGAPIGD